MNFDKITQAIEEDAGIELDNLKQSLSEMQQGIAARTHTPEQILIRTVRKKNGVITTRFCTAN